MSTPVLHSDAGIAKGHGSSRSSLDKSGLNDAATDYTSINTTSDLAETDPPPFKWSTWLFNRKVYKELDLDAVSTRRSVYDDPDMAPHYYPKKEYENAHRFDPKARWTVREEKVRVQRLSAYFRADVPSPGFDSQDRLEGHALGGHQLFCAESGPRQSQSSQYGQLLAGLGHDH